MKNESDQGSGGVNFKTHAKPAIPDLVCLSHLRWNFVYQRPQHIMARWARERRVFFFEEPIFEERLLLEKRDGYLALNRQLDSNVVVAVPHLRTGMSQKECMAAQSGLLEQLLNAQGSTDYLLWYYTPMALSFTRHLKPCGVIYDCMDELSAFSNAPKELCEQESELFKHADVVMTGGYSLYEAKVTKHRNVHPFPSSVDRAHFTRARMTQEDPADQAAIPHPRLGFFGVIDERMDLELLNGLALARPDWHLVLIGPVVKISPDSLPRQPNIHYLGMKSYEALPAYLSGWDVALMPFARNQSTRFISPTKTPEYLAAGKPVVSTSIRDVVRPYGQQGLVRIADTVPDFVAAVDSALREGSESLLPKIDAMLAQTSWDLTWQRMKQVVESAVKARKVELGSPSCLTI